MNDSLEDKKGLIFFLIAAVIILLLSVSYRLVAQENELVFYAEAENLRYERLELVSDSSASGNLFLKMSESGFIEWNCILSKSGYYKLNIGYRTSGGSKEEYLVVNEKTIPIGFAFSESWQNFSQDIYLEERENILRLLPSWGYVDIDYISISLTNLIPRIKPKINYYYKNAPRKSFFFVSNYKKQIENVLLNGQEVNFEVDPYLFKEENVFISISTIDLEELENGTAKLQVKFSDESFVESKIVVQDSCEYYGLKILTPDVEHGSAVLVILPNDETLLIDCAKDWIRDSILIPFIYENKISQIDHFIITHYHGDHDSGDKGEKIKHLFNATNFYDYKSFKTGDEFNIGNVKFKILNSYGDGSDENTNSFSFNLKYNGFVYQHGADTYASNQERILIDFPEEVECDVFYANHHFHGSIYPEYIKKMEPRIILLQAQEAIYARGAYMHDFLQNVEPYLQENSNIYIETLPNIEVGTVVLHVNGKDDWKYETYMNRKH